MSRGSITKDEVREVLVEIAGGYDGVEIDHAHSLIMDLITRERAYGRLDGEHAVLDSVIQSDPSMTSLIRWNNETERKIKEAKALG